MTALSLNTDLDPDHYIALHQAVDETATERLLDAREIQVRDRVRELVATEIAPHAALLDHTHAFAHDSYQALARAGLAGLLFPEKWGGTGDSHVSYAAAMEEISAGCAATSLVYMTQMHAAFPIWKAGSENLADTYIPRLLDGMAYGSLGVTEPDAGSDVSSLRTRARPMLEGGVTVAYEISGSKTFITTGDRAGVVITFATTDPALGRRGVTAFLVDGDSEGLAHGEPLEKVGMHGSSTAELFFSGVRVPAEHKLGDEGAGWQLVMASVGKSRLSAAAQGVGIARSAYTRALIALRQLYGSRLPDVVSFTLAELRGEILQGRLLLLASARELDHGDITTGQIGILKQRCTDLGWHVSERAARLLGPYGDLVDLGIERCLRDAKVTQIYDGTNEVQRLLIGRDVRHLLEDLE